MKKEDKKQMIDNIKADIDHLMKVERFESTYADFKKIRRTNLINADIFIQMLELVKKLKTID